MNGTTFFSGHANPVASPNQYRQITVIVTGQTTRYQPCHIATKPILEIPPKRNTISHRASRNKTQYTMK